MRSLLVLVIIALTLEPAGAPKYPDLSKFSPSNWGRITFSPETGGFTFDGHPDWYGLGQCRPDGKVFILWTRRGTEEPCPGVYYFLHDRLYGH